MRYIKNSKKSEGFFYLITLVVFIFFLSLNIFNLNPQQNNVKISNAYAGLTQDYSVINLKIHSQSLYLKSKISSIIQNSFQDFPISFENTQLSSSSKNGFVESCYNNGLILWKNELNTYNCLPSFSNSLENNFNSELEKNLKQNLESGFSVLNVKNFLVSSVYNSKQNNLRININVSYYNYTNFGSITKNITITNYVELNSYFKLLTSLQTVISNFNQINKKYVPSCIDNLPTPNPSDPLFYCINQSFQTQMKTFDNNYYFELKKISTKTGYYGINFMVFSKNSNTQILNFGGIYKNEIPFNLVSYSLSNLDNANNVVSITINKPTFIVSPISYYIIFYSYSNFLLTQDKTKFISLLSKGQIPSSFSSSGSSSIGSNSALTYSFSPSTLGLSDKIYALTVPAPSTYSNGNFNVNLYQTLQSVSSNSIGKYGLLSNNPLYILVFAVNQNYNYPTSNLKTQSITPQYLLKPLPFSSGDFTIQGKAFGFLNAINISLNAKLSNPPQKIMIVLQKSTDTSSLTECIQRKSCFYTTIDYPFSSVSDLIITSSSSTSKSNVIQTNFLSSGGTYKVYLIPLNLNNKGYLQDGSVNYYSVSNSNQNEFSLNSITNQVNIFSKQITLEQGIPNPETSITVQGITNSNGILYLNWYPNQGFDVSSLNTKVSAYDGSGNLIFSIPESFSSLSAQINLNGMNLNNIQTLVISNIVPVSSSGLYDKNPQLTKTTKYVNPNYSAKS